MGGGGGAALELDGIDDWISLWTTTLDTEMALEVGRAEEMTTEEIVGRTTGIEVVAWIMAVGSLPTAPARVGVEEGAELAT